MRRPWQIWVLYALSLAVVVPAMAWLTVKAHQLDKAEAAARQCGVWRAECGTNLAPRSTFFTPRPALDS